MKTKKEFVVDALFLIALALVVIGLLIDIHVSGKNAEATYEPATEATYEPTTSATTEETIEYIPTIPQEETEPTESSSGLYDVPLDAELQLHIISESVKAGIDPAIIMAMAYKESSYRIDAIGDGGDSYGLLQVQPKHHYGRMQKLGCTDLLDPYQNVTVAVDYLAEQIDRYGDLAKGLVAYNRGHYAGTITKYAKSVMAMAEEMAVE